ncbi:MAG: hypothetical protein ING19_05575, partial [Azospirillum sp.]|nr:hypothetical protein [Azospirillum sp.]
MTSFEKPPQEFREKLWTEIRKLPQIAFLREETVDRWIESIYNIDRERAMWHVRRASGIGGSEIGELVSWRNGIFDTWKTPRDMVLSKLLIEPPSPENRHTVRGGAMEPFIQHLIRRRLPGAVRDVETLERIRAGRHREIPWCIGTPDDIWLIGGKRWTVDYKAPERKTLDGYMKEGVSLEYRAQTKQYDMICNSYGIKTDVLANIFVPADTLATHAFKYFDAVQRNPGLKLEDYDPPEIPGDMEIIVHPEDPDLEAAIVDAGNHYWNNYVMEGEFPSLSTRPKIVFENGPPEAVAEKARKLAQLRILGAQTYKRIDAAKQALYAEIKKFGRIGNGAVLPVSALNVSEKVTYRIEAMADRLEAVGVDRNTLKKIGEVDGLAAVDKIRELAELAGRDPEREVAGVRKTGELDQDIVLARFEEIGLSVSEYETIDFEDRVNAARSGPTGKAMDALKDAGGSIVDA